MFVPETLVHTRKAANNLNYVQEVWIDRNMRACLAMYDSLGIKGRPDVAHCPELFLSETVSNGKVIRASHTVIIDFAPLYGRDF